MFEKFLAVCFRQNAEHFGLQGDGDLARLLISASALGLQMKAMRPAVLFVLPAFEQAGLLHSLQQRRHGVRVAAHPFGEFALRDAARFQQSAHDGELVGRDAQVRDAAAEGLVQSIPRVSQQNGQTPPAGRVNRHRLGRTGFPGGRHDNL